MIIFSNTLVHDQIPKKRTTLPLPQLQFVLITKFKQNVGGAGKESLCIWKIQYKKFSYSTQTGDMAELLIEILLKLQQSQVQYLKRRSSNLVKCVTIINETLWCYRDAPAYRSYCSDMEGTCLCGSDQNQTDQFAYFICRYWPITDILVTRV